LKIPGSQNQIEKSHEQVEKAAPTPNEKSRVQIEKK
jgi:hypothetical protein